MREMEGRWVCLKHRDVKCCWLPFELDSVIGGACSAVVKGFPDTQNSACAILIASVNMTHQITRDVRGLLIPALSQIT